MIVKKRKITHREDVSFISLPNNWVLSMRDEVLLLMADDFGLILPPEVDVKSLILSLKNVADRIPEVYEKRQFVRLPGK